MMPASQHEYRLEHWQEWSRRNRQIFDVLRPGSKIGFLSKEELAQLRGRVLILQVAEPDVESYLADFTGFRQDLADVLFVAPGEALVAIERATGPNEAAASLRSCCAAARSSSTVSAPQRNWRPRVLTTSLVI